MQIKIRPATPNDMDDLTALAHQAKRHWGYSEELIRLWRPDLTFTRDYVTQHEVHVTETREGLLGVYALGGSGDEYEIEHLWVHPDYHGNGIGRCLFEHAVSIAAQAGPCKLKIVSDPNAEGFYSKMGAMRSGEQASKPKGRWLPVLFLNVSPSN